MVRIQYNQGSNGTLAPGDMRPFLPGAPEDSGSTAGNTPTLGYVLRVEHLVSSTDGYTLLQMSPQTVQLQTLGSYNLKRPISCVVELDGTEWLARTPDLDQVFGIGPTVMEAVASLKREIASLYEDLEEDDSFAPEWLPVHRFLRGLIEAL